MDLLCIDPGTYKSGVVIIDTDNMTVLNATGEIENGKLLDMLVTGRSIAEHIVIEMIQGMGMPVGQETFNTCLWIGRFIQAYRNGYDHTLIYRKDVKLSICGSCRAKDANIRQALLDRYSGTGDGKCPQVGTKKQPGPLFGISTHAWPALAVGHAWVELNKKA